MSGRIKDRTGIRYGRLIVIKFAGRDWIGYAFRPVWKCQCDCGNTVIVSGNSLQSGNTKSCGCLHKEVMGKQTGKNNPNYENKSCQTGKNHPGYIHGASCGKNIKVFRKLKEKKRRKDNYICQDCGITQEECKKKYGGILDVHHIDGDDTNNNLDNMISLCLSCHQKLHHKERRKIKCVRV